MTLSSEKVPVDLNEDKSPAYTTVEEKNLEYASSDDVSIGAKPQRGGEAFASGGQTRFYEPCENYEGRHRWDPKAEWTDKEEKRIIRKVRS